MVDNEVTYHQWVLEAESRLTLLDSWISLAEKTVKETSDDLAKFKDERNKLQKFVKVMKNPDAQPVAVGLETTDE